MTPLRVRLLADGASLSEMVDVEPLVEGFTTNPSLMRQAGVTDYLDFARAVLEIAKGKPVSFEVTCDDFTEMSDQAHAISKWGQNVFVKIPITNTKGQSSIPLIKSLVGWDVRVNVTAVFTRTQVEETVAVLSRDVRSCISVFAGRLADIGSDPVPFMAAMANYVDRKRTALIWASTREIYNVVQASSCGVHYITLSPSLIRKLPLLGKDATQHSLDTVREFYRDAQAVGAV